MPGAELAALLSAHGFDFFAGVPCSLFEDLIAALERSPRVAYVAAAREDAGLGVAAGAWLGGRRPAVLMQNSGLGTSLNALASLSLLYELPALLLVTWRGFEGRDAPEHLVMGEITPRLLELLGVPYRVLGPGRVDELVAWARREMDARERPVALLVPPGGIGAGAARLEHSESGLVQARPGSVPLAPSRPGPATTWTEGGVPETGVAPDVDTDREALCPVISRRAAIAAAVKQLGDEPVIHANGYVCRESFAVADRPQNFYMIGSMGLASAIGLGLARARPASATVVFDGDGNLMMNLGIVAMVGSLRPSNFVHLVFDNEVYGSTGNQPSPSREVRLDRIARSAGYRTTAVTAPDAIAAAVRAALHERGPHFVLVKVTTEVAEAPRIPHTPRQIRDRFRAAVGAA